MRILNCALIAVCLLLESASGMQLREGSLEPFLREPELQLQPLFATERFPNLMVAMDGTIIASWGNRTVRVRRSEDGGVHWGPEIVVAEPGFQGGGAIVDEVTGDLLLFVEDQHPPAPLTLYRSQDHGKTWTSETTDIQPDSQGRMPSMHMNEAGITLRHGAHRGRLIRASRYYAGRNHRDQWPDHLTNAIYSDDRGRTWRTSEPFPENGTGEAAIAELSDGRLYYNSRVHWDARPQHTRRREAWSTDGGQTWHSWKVVDVLPDGDQHRSYGLMGGLVRLPVAGHDILIFSNIETPNPTRERATVWVSADGGRTWPVRRLVYDGPSAYSSLAAGRPGTPGEGWIYLLFEGGPGTSGGGHVARFNLSWILAGTPTGDGPVPFQGTVDDDCSPTADDGQAPPAADTEERFFRERILPVLETHCFDCHASNPVAERERDGSDPGGGLRLDSPAALRRGGDSGSAIVAGDSGRSLLIQAIRHQSGLRMPPEGQKLPDQVIADFVRWIDAGAVDPRAEIAQPIPDSQARLLEEGRLHWAFQPLVRPAVPGNDSRAALHPIDAFLLRSGLMKTTGESAYRDTQADRRTFIRRATFDLTGLPPAPEETRLFLADDSDDAVERLVDRLLASPRFGEKAAQQWLDVVRFAETEGYEYDRHIPDAWRYRDYVISAFNQDKAFDQFITEQLAGDELDETDHELLTASIFHRLGPVRRNAGNPEIALSRNEVLTERTDIIGTAFLGLTIGCARCHHHKLEPISHQDYYHLQAYTAATAEHNLVLADETSREAWEQQNRAVQDRIADVQKRAQAATEVQEKQRLAELLRELEEQRPLPLPTIPSVRNDHERRTAIHVLRRGVWEQKLQQVGPRPPAFLLQTGDPEIPVDEPAPRIQLARWLTSDDNPLTARVIANRIWQQYFGIGLVETANDFGLQGARPQDAQLLDWLAATLRENEWRLKSLHRLIVTSDAYRRGTVSPRRLSAEEIRDAMLAVSGRLNLQSGGPSVMVPVDAELVNLLYQPAQWAVTPDVSQHFRRSVYLIYKRNLRLPFFESLDAPALQTSCGRRESSIHPPQALELLNGHLTSEQAAAFAERLLRECHGDLPLMVERGFQLALGRPPADRELQRSVQFLQHQPLTEFTLALFNLNEFLYVR